MRNSEEQFVLSFYLMKSKSRARWKTEAEEKWNLVQGKVGAALVENLDGNVKMVSDGSGFSFKDLPFPGRGWNGSVPKLSD